MRIEFAEVSWCHQAYQAEDWQRKYLLREEWWRQIYDHEHREMQRLRRVVSSLERELFKRLDKSERRMVFFAGRDEAKAEKEQMKLEVYQHLYELLQALQREDEGKR